MGARRATELLAVPVTHNEIPLGRAIDMLFDLGAGRAIGLEIHCRDEARRFLPLGAARLGSDATEVGSPLSLLDDVGFYQARGTAFRDLRGVDVTRGPARLGTLADVAIRADGTIAGFVVDTPRGQARVAFGPTISLGRARKASAA